MDENIQYCPSCGSLINLFVRNPYDKVIPLYHLIVLLFAFFLIYFMFQFQFGTIFASFSSYFVLDLIFYYLFLKSNNDLIRDFFPYHKEFLLIIAFIILFSTIWIDFIVIVLFQDELVDFLSIIFFIIDFIIGFASAEIINMYIFNIRKKRKIDFKITDN
jgi:hypothetical protein